MKSYDIQENREVVWAVVRLMNPDPDRFIFDNEWDKIVSFKRDKEARKATKTRKYVFSAATIFVVVTFGLIKVFA